MNCILTGATKGIGRACAQRFAAEGFDLALCARTEADLLALKAELQAAAPNIRILTQAFDIRDAAAVKAFGAAAVAFFDNKVDILINNAGVFLPGAISKEDEYTLSTLLETNLYSAYHLTRAVLPAMLPHRSGHIFNMCSIASITAYPTGGSYSISKFALLGFNKVLREEMKPLGVRVTALLPGAVLTPAWGETTLPETRFIRATDISDALWACYKLSDSAVVEELLIRPQEGDI